MSTTVKQNVDHWLRGSVQGMKSMRLLMKGNQRVFAMFAGHLALEKMLKALCAVRGNPNAWGHDLLRLANIAGLGQSLSFAQKTELSTITGFNIEGRYNDYRNNFEKQCTEAFVRTWASTITVWYKYLKTIVLKERVNLPNNTTV